MAIEDIGRQLSRIATDLVRAGLAIEALRMAVEALNHKTGCSDDLCREHTNDTLASICELLGLKGGGDGK